MNYEQAIKNILTNILLDIEKTGRTTPELSVVRCEVSKSLIDIAKQYLGESE